MLLEGRRELGWTCAEGGRATRHNLTQEAANHVVRGCDSCAPGTASLPSSVRKTHLSCGQRLPCRQAALIPGEGGDPSLAHQKICLPDDNHWLQDELCDRHTGTIRKLVRTFTKPIRKASFILFGVTSFQDNACLGLPGLSLNLGRN